MTKKRGTPRKKLPLALERNATEEAASFPIVGVGASAGGLDAFKELLEHLPLDTGMAFVLVQHLDPRHESALTQILARSTSLPVHDVTNNLRIAANRVYVIPPNTDLAIAHGKLKLQARPKTRTPHRSIDFFFESLAQDQRERAIGVILSGTATDGTLGLEAIKLEGGITFAQDESARYDSMPKSAVAAGCVDFVLSPANIAQEIGRIAKHPYIRGHAVEETRPPEDDRAFETAHEDDARPLPLGGHGPPRTGASKARPETERGRGERSEANRGENGFKKIMFLLRNHSGVDFSLYKSTTIQRRITRRMVLEKQDTIDNYAQLLRGNAKELNALYSDVLISVTSFFRNPEAFDVLERKIFPKLLQQRGDEPVRVWVLGCSTGQEAYSIAIAFMEASQKASPMRKLQVFATDLNDALLDKARHGLYARSLAQDISPERLRRFFVEEDGGYRINKALREMVVFARQNLLSDPPFSRMDLISCRNLLIYLEPSLQKKVLPTFHYALKPGGYLFLGGSESIGSFTDLFEPADSKNKIYSKKAAPPVVFQLPVAKERGARGLSGRRMPLRTSNAAAPEGFHDELNAQREADRVAVHQFAPPGVLVNAALQVLQFRGPTGAYLEPPTGKASFDVLKMAREGLMLPLRAAVNKAKKENKSARKENVRVQQNGSTRTVNVEVIPLKNLRERCFLILFEDVEKEGRAGAPSPLATESRRRSGPAAREGSRRVTELETDLSETRDYLQSIQEQHEAANEELHAANEEVQSANEELQSVNEELETSKEELESTNEELTTVNEEMANRNTELNRLNSDLTNLQTSTKLAIVLLGRDLAIRRFSPEAEKQLKLAASDLGRPIGRIRHDLILMDAGGARDPLGKTSSALPRARGRRASAHGASAGADARPIPPIERSFDLESLAAEVIASVRERVVEARDRDGGWYSVRVRPYFTLDNKVDGAVLVLVNIDEQKRSEQAVAMARDYAEAIVRTMRDPLLILNADLRVDTANEAFFNMFKISPAEAQGCLVYDLSKGQWDIPELRKLLEDILPRNNFFNDFEVTREFATIGRRTMLFNARTLNEASDKRAKILVGIQDITEIRHFAAAAQESSEKFRLLFERSPLPKWAVELATLRFVDVNEAAIKHYGYTREEFLRMSVLDVRTPESGAALQATLARAPHRAPEKDVCQHRKKNGEVIDVEVSGAEIELSGRRIWLANIYDITERLRAEKALREAGERFRFMAESMPQKLFTAKANGDVDYFNPQWSEYTGLSFEQIRDWGWTQLIHPDDVADNICVWQRSIETGEPFRFEHRFRGADGQFRWHLSRASALKDIEGKILMWIGSSTDIQEVKDADRSKDEFLALLAHELRGPLAPLSNAVQIMKGADDDRDLMQRARSAIERNLLQMTRLVDDLLDVSRISRGKLVLRREPVELASVIHHVIDNWRPAMESARHELTVTLPPQPVYVDGDPVRLAQIFGNLLSNALKYSEPGSPISLAAGRHDRDVVVSVKDAGIGIPTDKLSTIFEMFTQLDRSLERSRGGLGIGLTLVRRLAEMHGGSITALSEGPGRGSEFVVRLPALPEMPKAQSRKPATVEAVASPGRRVLIVDDNRDAAESLAMLLRMSGHDTHTAHDGLAAVEAAATFRPEVMLLDIGLPKLNGYDVCRKIREQPWGKNIMLVALTGWSQDEDRRRSRDAGFDDHLVKPVDHAALAKILSESRPWPSIAHHRDADDRAR